MVLYHPFSSSGAFGSTFTFNFVAESTLDVIRMVLLSNTLYFKWKAFPSSVLAETIRRFVFLPCFTSTYFFFESSFLESSFLDLSFLDFLDFSAFFVSASSPEASVFSPAASSFSFFKSLASANKGRRVISCSKDLLLSGNRFFCS